MEEWIEQRQHVRQHVRISGMAVGADGLLRVSVVIVNLSRSGAMIETVEDSALPDELSLLFNHTTELSRKIWHEGRLAGFEFIDLPGA
jgi:hypothetical protein